MSAHISRVPKSEVPLRKEDDSATRKDLIKKLLRNEIDIPGLQILKKNITATELSIIIQRIYDLNERYILEISNVDGFLRYLNNYKNRTRNRYFTRKIKRGFRQPGNPHRKVIVAEGDSWFNYPLILTDIIDRIRMEKDFALYSVAGGGDWLLNMLAAREYVEELTIIRPDVFLISGGGNDLVGSRRLAAILDATGNSNEFENNEWAKALIKTAEQRSNDPKKQNSVPLDKTKFDTGIKYLSKDFFALLMFFHLQYHSLVGGVLKTAKFDGVKIITQGYDFAVPSSKLRLGPNPFLWYVPFIRMFLGHSSWLKVPLLLRGVPDVGNTHSDIIYAMIYLFNEMVIEMGSTYNVGDKKKVFHIDSRGLIDADGWVDELHAKPEYTMKIGKVFIGCIKDNLSPTYDGVYVVKNIAV